MGVTGSWHFKESVHTLKYCTHWLVLGDPVSQSNFFHFHVVFGKNCPDNRLAPRSLGIGPSGKSWIHHYLSVPQRNTRKMCGYTCAMRHCKIVVRLWIHYPLWNGNKKIILKATKGIKNILYLPSNQKSWTLLVILDNSKERARTQAFVTAFVFTGVLVCFVFLKRHIA